MEDETSHTSGQKNKLLFEQDLSHLATVLLSKMGTEPPFFFFIKKKQALKI